MQGEKLYLLRKRYGLSQEELGELISALHPHDGDTTPIKRKTINKWEHMTTEGNVGEMLGQCMEEIDTIYYALHDVIIVQAKDMADDGKNIQLPAWLADSGNLPIGMREMILGEVVQTLQNEGYQVQIIDDLPSRRINDEDED